MAGAVDEYRIKAFEFAQESTKQLITLATGILTITITFREHLENAAGLPQPTGMSLLHWAWVTYLISVVAGVWTLLALTGELAPGSSGKGEPSIYGLNVRVPSGLQVLSFVIATVLTVAHVVEWPLWG